MSSTYIGFFGIYSVRCYTEYCSINIQFSVTAYCSPFVAENKSWMMHTYFLFYSAEVKHSKEGLSPVSGAFLSNFALMEN